MNRILTDKDLDKLTNKEIEKELEFHGISFRDIPTRNNLILTLKSLLQKKFIPGTRPFEKLISNIQDISIPFEYVRLDYDTLNFLSIEELREEARNQEFELNSQNTETDMRVEFMTKIQKVAENSKIKPYKPLLKKLTDIIVCHSNVLVSTNLISVFKGLTMEDLEDSEYKTLKNELINQDVKVEEHSDDFMLKAQMLSHVKKSKNLNVSFTKPFKQYLYWLMDRKKHIAYLRYISHMYKHFEQLIPEIKIRIDMKKSDFEEEQEVESLFKNKEINTRKDAVKQVVRI